MINIPYPVIDMQRTGDNIKALRLKRKISVSELQNFLGFTTPQAIYLWETGKNLPTVDHLLVLSKVFEVSMNDIIVVKEPLEDNKSKTHGANNLFVMAKTCALLLAA